MSRSPGRGRNRDERHWMLETTNSRRPDLRGSTSAAALAAADAEGSTCSRCGHGRIDAGNVGAVSAGRRYARIGVHGVRSGRLPAIRKRLGEMLVERGKLDPNALERTLRLQQGNDTGGRRERLGELLVNLGLVAQREVTEALAQQLGLQVIEAERLSRSSRSSRSA